MTKPSIRKGAKNLQITLDNFTREEAEEKNIYAAELEGRFMDLYFTPRITEEDRGEILELKYKCMFHVPIPECEEYYKQAKEIADKYNQK